MTLEANFCCERPMSLNALYIMVVELMANIPPRKMQSIRVQPKAWPTPPPRATMLKIIVTAATAGATPIFRIFFIEKSRPREKRSEHYADVGPGVDVGLVDHRHRQRHIRRDDKSGYDISEN